MKIQKESKIYRKNSNYTTIITKIIIIYTSFAIFVEIKIIQSECQKKFNFENILIAFNTYWVTMKEL